jgi:hypothetical protein
MITTEESEEVSTREQSHEQKQRHSSLDSNRESPRLPNFFKSLY